MTFDLRGIIFHKIVTLSLMKEQQLSQYPEITWVVINSLENTHSSSVVVRVVNHNRCPVRLRNAYGTKGERRRCPAGLPLGDCSDVVVCICMYNNKFLCIQTRNKEKIYI